MVARLDIQTHGITKSFFKVRGIDGSRYIA